MQTQRLAVDIGQKACAHGVGHVAFLQQFGGAADGRQRRLHLVGQGVHVLLDVGLAVDLAAHRFGGGGQPGQLLVRQLRRADSLAVAHLLDIVHQPSDRAIQPEGHAGAEQQGAEQNHPAALPEIAVGEGDERMQTGVGFAEGQHADQLIALIHRCGDVHQAAGVVFGVDACGTRTVLATQGERHVAPLRIVLADLLRVGVVEHAAIEVGQVDHQLGAGLVS